jgi:hypothetical protein
MSSFMTQVENLPIVFIALLEKIRWEELEENFQMVTPSIEEHGQLIWILDVTCWEATLEALTYLAGVMAVRKTGSFTDLNVTTFLVSKDEITEALEKSLADHRKQLEMVRCPSLDLAYDFAMNILNGWVAPQN